MAGGTSLIMAYDGNSSGANASTNFASTAQSFFTFSGCLEGSNSSYAASSESTQQIPFPASTMSKLWCRVTTAATSSSTVVLRKNSTNGNETFSIGANQTGAFSDNSHTDTINSGDLLDVGITPGSTALEVTIIAATFTASTSTNTSTVLASVNLLTNTLPKDLDRHKLGYLLERLSKRILQREEAKELVPLLERISKDAVRKGDTEFASEVAKMLIALDGYINGRVTLI